MLGKQLRFLIKLCKTSKSLLHIIFILCNRYIKYNTEEADHS